MGRLLNGFVGVLCWAVLLCFIVIPVDQADATSQWTRKYDVDCQTCHTAFPRLNHFGEKFMRNGYQMPETMDGDETKTKVGDNTFIDEVQNLFGMRINLTPLAVETEALNKNGATETAVNIGNADWLQLFVAGSIYKNVSIFIEAEITGDAAHFSWMRVGWHNVYGPQGVLNFRVGNLSTMDWHVMSGRLRMIPNIKIGAHSNIKSAEGTNTDTTAGGVTLEDQIAVASAQPAAEVYGYYGPFLYSVGISSGADADDANQFKNFFGTLRAEMEDGPFAGSAVSGYGMLGYDSANTAASQVRDKFYRLSGGANVRYDNLDLIVAYIHVNDDDWDLSTAGALENKQNAIAAQLGYMVSEKFFTAVQYDYIDDDSAVNDMDKLSLHLGWFPRQNLRVGLTPRIDLTGADLHEVILNLRAMF